MECGVMARDQPIRGCALDEDGAAAVALHPVEQLRCVAGVACVGGRWTAGAACGCYRNDDDRRCPSRRHSDTVGRHCGIALALMTLRHGWVRQRAARTASRGAPTAHRRRVRTAGYSSVEG